MCIKICNIVREVIFAVKCYEKWGNFIPFFFGFCKICKDFGNELKKIVAKNVTKSNIDIQGFDDFFLGIRHKVRIGIKRLRNIAVP